MTFLETLLTFMEGLGIPRAAAEEIIWTHFTLPQTVWRFPYGDPSGVEESIKEIHRAIDYWLGYMETPEGVKKLICDAVADPKQWDELCDRIRKATPQPYVYPIGTEVIITGLDPYHNGACVAQPPIGCKGKIVKMWNSKPPLDGKIPVEFSEESLGYEPSDKGGVTIYMDLRIVSPA